MDIKREPSESETLTRQDSSEDEPHTSTEPGSSSPVAHSMPVLWPSQLLGELSAKADLRGALAAVDAVALAAQAPRGVAPFLTKLWQILHDAEAYDSIRWLDDQGFLIADHVTLGRTILPRFFKHNNVCSFVRQLNTYGFYKGNEGDVHASPHSSSPEEDDGSQQQQQPPLLLQFQEQEQQQQRQRQRQRQQQPQADVAQQQLLKERAEYVGDGSDLGKGDSKYTGWVFRQRDGGLRRGMPQNLSKIQRRKSTKRRDVSHESLPDPDDGISDRGQSTNAIGEAFSAPSLKVTKRADREDAASLATVRQLNTFLVRQVDALRSQQHQQQQTLNLLMKELRESRQEQKDLRKRLVALGGSPDSPPSGQSDNYSPPDVKSEEVDDDDDPLGASRQNRVSEDDLAHAMALLGNETLGGLLNQDYEHSQPFAVSSPFGSIDYGAANPSSPAAEPLSPLGGGLPDF